MTTLGSIPFSAEFRRILTTSPLHSPARQAAGSRALEGKRPNTLGLSTQVPAHAIYLTDGRRRSVQVGGQTIELRHAEPRSLAGAGRTEGMIIQALRHLGPEQDNGEVIERLRQTLTAREKAALHREALSALVGWSQSCRRSPGPRQSGDWHCDPWTPSH